MLLRTRFYIPPLREKDVVRARLLEKLKAVDGGELALVVAPAGYGKTTMVSQWLHYCPHSFAWLSLDQSHSGEQRFWQYLIAALQTMMPELGQQAQQHVMSNEIEQTVISLLNDLDAHALSHTHQAMTLVLDDFHKIENPTLLASIILFLDHLPPSLRLIITSRTMPDLQLARRRSSGQLHEVQQQDLAFDESETEELIAQSVSTADGPSYQLLRKKLRSAEGWAVGLQLALMSYDAPSAQVTEAKLLDHSELRDHSKLPDHSELPDHSALPRDIADYLFEEVFNRLDDEFQHFLVLTAVPKKFCAALANALCENQSGQSNIKHLDRFNVFLVPLDNHRVWFRYHDLFRQLLLQHFSELSPKRQRALHQRAAYWFEEAGYSQDAIHHWVKLQDWQQLERLWQSAQFDEATLVTWQHLIPHSVYLTLAQDAKTTAPQVIHVDTTEPLTKREKQVMALVKQGLSNKEIADSMHVSLNTLKVHIRNLYGKMGVENRKQALQKLSDFHSAE